jgi:hypothetical protein
VATTVRATTKAARATVAGATRMTATLVVKMTANGDVDNEDNNGKNNDKATTKPTTTTEEGERCQSRRDNRGGGFRCPRNAAIAPTATSLRHTSVGSCYSRVEGLNSLLHMGIHRKSGRSMKKIWNRCQIDLEWLAGQPFQILDKKSKIRPCKNIWPR